MDGKFVEKMGRKTFVVGVGWREEREKNWWGLGVFSSGPENVLSKMEKKLSGKNLIVK